MVTQYDTDAFEAFKLARTTMLFNHAFFGTLAMKLDLVKVTEEDNSIFKTAAVDGKNLYYNEKFILSLSKAERIFLISHEILHCVFNHLVRKASREPSIYNMACDYVINAMLIDEGLKMPSVGLYNKKYIDWSAEDVYDDLIKNNVTTQPTLDCHAGDPGFPGGDAAANESDKSKDKSKDQLSEDEQREIEDFWKDNIVQAAASCDSGNLPSGIRRLIDDFLEPKMDWREIIQTHIQSCVRNDYSWMRPNKRTFGSGITMPSMIMDDGIEIAVAIDTSGSVSEDMLKDFLSEIKGVMDQFSSYKIHIACFDTTIYNPQTFTEDDDLLNYELAGFGGTEFMAWWNFAKDEPWIENVGKILFFTDGYPYGQWGIEELGEDKTVWIIHGGTNEGPFGTTVFYDKVV